jgi:hypothetical protein
MSKLTKALLCNIDYEFVKKKRIENFLVLHGPLQAHNGTKIFLDDKSVPMIYPFRTGNVAFRKKLIEHKIYIATYWPNIFNWSNENMLEYSLAKQIMPLPIDQRYDGNMLLKIIKLIK